MKKIQQGFQFFVMTNHLFVRLLVVLTMCNCLCVCCRHWYQNETWFDDPGVRKVENNTHEVQLARNEGRNLTFIQVIY